MPDFTRVINLAYQRILGRPADPGGLDSYNRAMNAGLTEADMRESLLRSAEYADKHPSREGAPLTKRFTAARKPAKKTKARGSRKTSRKSR
ncbi:MAG TPA: DUF4214 domain-containing protein [Vicinamibacteria bacterium]|nr:DUF4214 domain-containing protein [Vicinamibacteria bacterium]